MSVVVGIDLGTTNSVVSYLKRGKAEVIPIEGKNIFPSVLSIRDGEIIVGIQAKARMMLSPETSVCSTKRDMGKDVTYDLGTEMFTPEDVAYYILKTIKEKAGSVLGEKIQQAVITVPAYFTSEQREATKRAAERSGLNVLRLMPEPTAAALDYGIDQHRDQIIMVYDLGGGTFDISIMKVENNEFEVLAVDGNSRLGGDDFDELVCDMMYKKINDELGVDITSKKDKKYISALMKIRENAEKAKMDLSDLEEVEIIIPNLIDDYSFEMTLTRDEFNRLVEPLLEETIDKIYNALKLANLTRDDIDRVLLVGGSTKMPIVKEKVRDSVKDPYVAPNVDEVVSRGAAIMAASLCVPETYEESSGVNGSHTVNGFDGVNLDKKIIVKEKVVFTYGIDMLDENRKLYFRAIIKRGSTLPAKGAVLGYTSRPLQKSVVITIYRGESKSVKENQYLGELELDIVNVSEKNVPVCALFEIDENMIITFTSIEIPMTEEYSELIDSAGNDGGNMDVNLINKYLLEGKLKGKKIKIDAKANLK
ncbi:Hsp70 family protein [Clostridium sp. BJN0013]|uniref:Hsp70 family protein n=1 Tax=Clostridium sp. BJN0013 TaxID=3236840 RepID=UPI0034C5C5D0